MRAQLYDWIRRATGVDWFLLALRLVVVAVVGTGFVSGLLHPRYGREEWFSFLVFGLTIGAIYALIALGYMFGRPLGRKSFLRDLAGGTSAVMFPAYLMRHDDRWPRWVSPNKPQTL